MTNDIITTSPRPLGFWLKVVDHRIRHAMREAFAEHGITRRDWRRLNVVARGAGDSAHAARLAEHPEKLAHLVERGWVQGEPGSWTLTDAGRLAYDELLQRVQGIRARVAGSVSPEDFATTLASLEAIARALGYSDDERMPRSGRRGRLRHHSRRSGACGERPASS